MLAYLARPKRSTKGCADREVRPVPLALLMPCPAELQAGER